MNEIKIVIIATAAMAMAFIGIHDATARGGGGGGGHGGHGRWNRYNNNVYGVVGYDDGYGVADDAIDGFDSGPDTDYQQGDSAGAEYQPSAANVQQQADSIVPLGAQVTMLPPGSQDRNIGGAQFYQNGDTWYKPYFGANGVYYEVVPQP